MSTANASSHHKLPFRILQNLVIHTVWILKEIILRGSCPITLQQLTQQQMSWSFSRKNAPFPAVTYSVCPFRTFANKWSSFATLTHDEWVNESCDMAACWNPVTWLAQVWITESSLWRLTDKLLLSSNLKLFAGLQTQFLRSPNSCYFSALDRNESDWSYPSALLITTKSSLSLLSQCHALRKVKNAAFVVTLSKQYFQRECPKSH